MKFWLGIGTIILAIIIAGYLFINPKAILAPSPFPTISPHSSPSTSPLNTIDPNDVPKEMTLEGEYSCLPHKDTSGPQTLECARGLKLSDGTYVVTDLEGLLHSDTSTKFQTGTMLRLTGLYVPAEQLNTDMWQKYPIEGIMKVTNVVALD